MDKILQGFQLKVLQSVSQVRKKLEANNISWEDFDEWITKKLSTGDNKLTPMIVQRFCPKCGHRLVITAVNDKPSTQLDGDWQSMWQCDHCGWDELSKSSKRDEELLYLVDNTDNRAAGVTRIKSKKRTQSRIIDPRRVRMLYYSNPRRRMR